MNQINKTFITINNKTQYTGDISINLPYFELSIKNHKTNSLEKIQQNFNKRDKEIQCEDYSILNPYETSKQLLSRNEIIVEPSFNAAEADSDDEIGNQEDTETILSSDNNDNHSNISESTDISILSSRERYPGDNYNPRTGKLLERGENMRNQFYMAAIDKYAQNLTDNLLPSLVNYYYNSCEVNFIPGCSSYQPSSSKSSNLNGNRDQKSSRSVYEFDEKIMNPNDENVMDNKEKCTKYIENITSSAMIRDDPEMFKKSQTPLNTTSYNSFNKPQYPDVCRSTPLHTPISRLEAVSRNKPTIIPVDKNMLFDNSYLNNCSPVSRPKSSSVYNSNKFSTPIHESFNMESAKHTNVGEDQTNGSQKPRIPSKFSVSSCRQLPNASAGFDLNVFENGSTRGSTLKNQILPDPSGLIVEKNLNNLPSNSYNTTKHKQGASSHLVRRVKRIDKLQRSTGSIQKFTIKGCCIAADHHRDVEGNFISTESYKSSTSSATTLSQDFNERENVTGQFDNELLLRTLLEDSKVFRETVAILVRNLSHAHHHKDETHSKEVGSGQSIFSSIEITDTRRANKSQKFNEKPNNGDLRKHREKLLPPRSPSSSSFQNLEKSHQTETEKNKSKLNESFIRDLAKIVCSELGNDFSGRREGLFKKKLPSSAPHTSFNSTATGKQTLIREEDSTTSHNDGSRTGDTHAKNDFAESIARIICRKIARNLTHEKNTSLSSDSVKDSHNNHKMKESDRYNYCRSFHRQNKHSTPKKQLIHWYPSTHCNNCGCSRGHKFIGENCPCNQFGYSNSKFDVSDITSTDYYVDDFHTSLTGPINIPALDFGGHLYSYKTLVDSKSMNSKKPNPCQSLPPVSPDELQGGNYFLSTSRPSSTVPIIYNGNEDYSEADGNFGKDYVKVDDNLNVDYGKADDNFGEDYQKADDYFGEDYGKADDNFDDNFIAKPLKTISLLPPKLYNGEEINHASSKLLPAASPAKTDDFSDRDENFFEENSPTKVRREKVLGDYVFPSLQNSFKPSRSTVFSPTNLNKRFDKTGSHIDTEKDYDNMDKIESHIDDLTLKEALRTFRPDFIVNSWCRQQHISFLSDKRRFIKSKSRSNPSLASGPSQTFRSIIHPSNLDISAPAANAALLPLSPGDRHALQLKLRRKVIRLKKGNATEDKHLPPRSPAPVQNSATVALSQQNKIDRKRALNVKCINNGSTNNGALRTTTFPTPPESFKSKHNSLNALPFLTQPLASHHQAPTTTRITRGCTPNQIQRRPSLVDQNETTTPPSIKIKIKNSSIAGSVSTPSSKVADRKNVLTVSKFKPVNLDSTTNSSILQISSSSSRKPNNNNNKKEENDRQIKRDNYYEITFKSNHPKNSKQKKR